MNIGRKMFNKKTSEWKTNKKRTMQFFDEPRRDTTELLMKHEQEWWQHKEVTGLHEKCAQWCPVSRIALEQEGKNEGLRRGRSVRETE